MIYQINGIILNIQYNIVFSRRRTLSIHISPDKGVIVKAPFNTPVKVIEKALDQKSVWITRSLHKFNSLKRLDDKNGYSDGDQLLLFGRKFGLKVIPSLKYFIKLGQDDTIEAGYPGEPDPAIIKARMEEWFRSVARDKLTGKFREILLRYKDFGFRPTGFTVRKMKSRWGSCSSKGKIALSYDLIRLDDVFSEYVIIHELCHLKHHNHSTDYYSFLSEVYPGWQEVRKELRQYIR